MSSGQKTKKSPVGVKLDSKSVSRDDIHGILDQLSDEISKLERENTYLKSTIENLITEDSAQPTSVKVNNPDRKLPPEEQFRQLLAENIQLKNKLLINNLTNKERLVLKMIANGFTNKEIAKKLGRSHHTITTHRKSLLSKLKINNTAALIRFAAKNGLI